jgi:hypothetical protein
MRDTELCSRILGKEPLEVTKLEVDSTQGEDLVHVAHLEVKPKSGRRPCSWFCHDALESESMYWWGPYISACPTFDPLTLAEVLL